MLFTWSTQDLCIVFRGWHITGTGSLIFSLLAIVLLTAGYEAIREVSRRYDLYAKSITERRSGDDLTSESPVYILLGRGVVPAYTLGAGGV
jgi:copper transporter 1